MLAPEHVPALFEPFRRDGADRIASESGFGLGLSIVQSIVEAHGGRLQTTARPEGGLDVIVVLPPARSQTAQPERSQPLPAVTAVSDPATMVDG